MVYSGSFLQRGPEFVTLTWKKCVYVKDSILSINEVMFMDKWISIDPKMCHGQACIKGTRISVHQIIRMMANGDTIEELLGEYPPISRDDILACLNYAASTAKKNWYRSKALLERKVKNGYKRKFEKGDW